MKLNAVNLKYTLIGLIMLVSAGIGAVFYFSYNMLVEAVAETGHAHTDVALGTEKLAAYQKLQTKLDSVGSDSDVTSQLMVDSKDSQDKIISDLNSLASRAGIKVSGYSFDKESKDAGSTGATNGVGTTSPSPAPVAPTTPTIGNGLPTVTASLSFPSTVPYVNYIKFLKAIESNLVQMQVSGIDLTPDAGDPTLLSNPSLKVIVYVKK